MNALSVIINIILILISIVLIVSVLMQQGQRQGLGAIGGGAETFFGKNKAKGYEAKLLLITKIGAAVFIVLAIVMTILTSHSAGKTPTADTTDEAIDMLQSAIDDAQTQAANDLADTEQLGELEAVPEADVTAAPEATAVPEATTAPEATEAAPEATAAVTE